MKIFKIPRWDLNPSQAIKIQECLSSSIICTGDVSTVNFIAGVDVSFDRENFARAAIVILKYPGLEILEVARVEGKAMFPYIPGLLSFREIPLLLEAFKRIKQIPDLVIVDGQGIAHPRKIGLASHLGLILNIPTIGCAKSHLFGEFDEPGSESGSSSYIIDKGGIVIGAVLRTKTDVKPLFVSVGHKIDLPSSIRWVLQCCQGYRLPEPTRKAHQASRGDLKSYTGMDKCKN